MKHLSIKEKHERFIREIQAPLRETARDELNKLKKENEILDDHDLNSAEIQAELEKKFNELFGDSNSEENDD